VICLFDETTNKHGEVMLGHVHGCFFRNGGNGRDKRDPPCGWRDMEISRWGRRLASHEKIGNLQKCLLLTVVSGCDKLHPNLLNSHLLNRSGQ
jgi:hypothetical protein